MDREKLVQRLEQQYVSKRDLISRIPLNIQPETLWEELLDRRRARSKTLPLHDCTGGLYWYVTTDKMVAASERIVSVLLDSDDDFDPYAEPPLVATLEEVFFTSYVEGSRMTMQDAMHFLQSGSPPRDIEEKLIINNRQAGAYASANLYRPIDEEILHALAYLLTDGMDEGGPDFRSKDKVDVPVMAEEEYSLPPASDISERTKELLAYIASPTQHPLVKAAVAHAWVLIIRPFTDGNERLGRLLSSMILLRSGYSFFRDVSISAIIARRSYGYYSAMANILRSENGSDLTYFIEFYLLILSYAVDEHLLKTGQMSGKARIAEMTDMPLNTPAASGSPVSGLLESDTARLKDAVDITVSGDGISETEDHIIQQESPAAEIEAPNDADAPTQAVLLGRVQYELYKAAERSKGNVSKALNLLAGYVALGKSTFTVADLSKDLEITTEQTGNVLSALRAKSLIKSIGRVGMMSDYSFTSELPLFTPNDYSREILLTIERLKENTISTKDRRLGEILENCLPKGLITMQDYEETGFQSRWTEDMRLIVQMGIVERINMQVYRITKQPIPGYPKLRQSQKEVVTTIFEKFGHNEFTLEMFAGETKYSKPHASACLHELSLFRVVSSRRTDTKLYHILVNPRENPEYFSEAL